MYFLPLFETTAAPRAALMSFARCYRPIAARDQAKLLAKAPGNLVTAAAIRSNAPP
jgi:hypothetical protein